jgi:hypothetical protein
MVDDILEIVDELPHFSSGESACAFSECVCFAICRSFPYDLDCVGLDARLENLNRETGDAFLGVCGRGFGSSREWVPSVRGCSVPRPAPLKYSDDDDDDDDDDNFIYPS